LEKVAGGKSLWVAACGKTGMSVNFFSEGMFFLPKK